jgi:hypothetical protein
VRFSDHDDVVEAVPPNGPDHALTVRILPWGPRRGEDLLDAHRTHSTNEVRAIDLVSVPNDVLRRRVVGEGIDQLLACPLRSMQRVEAEDRAVPGSAVFDTSTARRAIGNVAIGGDFFINKKVMIETGFFTDLSAAKNIPANPDRYYEAQVNRLGGTLSLGLNVAGVSLAIGSTVIYGKGDATGVLLDPMNMTAEYVRTRGTSRSIFLHITGATRAAADLGDKSSRAIEKRRAKNQREAEEEERRTKEAEEAERLEREAGEAE